jgi:hypothetical protein
MERITGIVTRPCANKVSYRGRLRGAQRGVRINSYIVEFVPEWIFPISPPICRVSERPAVDCSHPAYHGAPRAVVTVIKLVDSLPNLGVAG